MKKYIIKISRYNPGTDTTPTLKKYIVPYIDQGTVLEALQYIYEEIDSTLLFDYGCRAGTCGKCIIKIDGNPGLACETPLKAKMVLEPLDNLPVIRDLMVDRSRLTASVNKHSAAVSSLSDEI